jgi:hypothetical protein
MFLATCPIVEVQRPGVRSSQNSGDNFEQVTLFQSTFSFKSFFTIEVEPQCKKKT